MRDTLQAVWLCIIFAAWFAVGYIAGYRPPESPGVKPAGPTYAERKLAEWESEGGRRSAEVVDRGLGVWQVELTEWRDSRRWVARGFPHADRDAAILDALFFRTTQSRWIPELIKEPPVEVPPLDAWWKAAGKERYAYVESWHNRGGVSYRVLIVEWNDRGNATRAAATGPTLDDAARAAVAEFERRYGR